MIERTLTQEVLLTLLDKAALGGVLVVFGFWLNKRLEVFRSRQAMNSELAKRRSDAAATLSSLIRDFEDECINEIYSATVILHRELLVAGVAGVPEVLPQSAPDALRALEAVRSIHIPPDVEQRVLLACEPLTTALSEMASEVLKEIRRAEYWLGPDVAQSFKTYTEKYLEAFMELESSPGAWRRFASRRQELGRLKPDAARLLGARTE